MLADQVTHIGAVDRFTLEALSAADAPAIAGHLKRLAEVDRYSRFFSAMSDDGIDRYVDGFDWSRMIATGLYLDDTLIGLAELGWSAGGGPESAELAVTVDSAFRHRGIAGWLVKEAFRRARAAGVRQIEASWIGGNDSIAKIMRRHDARIWLAGSHWRGTAPIGETVSG